MQSTTLNNTKKLCLSALLAAMYVALDIPAAQFSLMLFGNNLKISLNGLPVIAAAVLFGPLWGMLVGFVGAFTGQMLTYGFTATTLFWVLPAVMRGLSVGLLFIAFRRSYKFPILCFEVFISSLLVTACNTLAMYIDSLVGGYYTMEMIVGGLVLRIISGTVTAVVLSLILLPVLHALKRVVKF